ncbi:hypothetical protein L209DRAFT_749120 [Thermothelomyces heterothallicus CBS 203.75]
MKTSVPWVPWVPGGGHMHPKPRKFAASESLRRLQPGLPGIHRPGAAGDGLSDPTPLR